MLVDMAHLCDRSKLSAELLSSSSLSLALGFFPACSRHELSCHVTYQVRDITRLASPGCKHDIAYQSQRQQPLDHISDCKAAGTHTHTHTLSRARTHAHTDTHTDHQDHALASMRVW